MKDDLAARTLALNPKPGILRVWAFDGFRVWGFGLQLPEERIKASVLSSVITLSPKP